MGKYPLTKPACYSSLDPPDFNAFTVIHHQRRLQALWDSCYKEKGVIFESEVCLQRRDKLEEMAKQIQNTMFFFK